MKEAYFAGGCFWCMEAPFLALEGVVDVIPGYMGGHVENPTYEMVSTGQTGHYESVRVTYDPDKVSFEMLLASFWEKIDPTDDFGQKVDRGPQYKTVIFYNDEGERSLAETSKEALDASGKYPRKIVTQILPVTVFYEAETYHHHYYEKMKVKYKNTGVSFF
ncbi:MAG: peptide-methionine (S)-S-oxide reductase MsrA [Clostridia bacterium]|nr:peptide-methionine (S)-S-oxide reductase MsrA [Clostridia bacterium]